MHVAIAGAFYLLFKKWSKVKAMGMYTIIFAILLLAPIGFYYFMIMPLFAANIGFFYLMMHFIFAGGVIALVANWTSIKKLF